MDCILPGSSVHRTLQARILEGAAISCSRDLPNPGIKPSSPASLALHVDSLLLRHQGSPTQVNIQLFFKKKWVKRDRRLLILLKSFKYKTHTHTHTDTPWSNLIYFQPSIDPPSVGTFCHSLREHLTSFIFKSQKYIFLG